MKKSILVAGLSLLSIAALAQRPDPPWWAGIAQAQMSVMGKGSSYDVQCRLGETPDQSPNCTPGLAASTDVNDVCGHGPGGTYSQRHRLSQDIQTKEQVLSRYGVSILDRAKYEDDHDLPLCLGASDSVANRWPQIRYGSTWVASDKDKLETWACEQVCRHHTMSLANAQAMFLAPADWRVSYCKAFPDDTRCDDLPKN